jgi:hypothetical protein
MISAQAVQALVGFLAFVGPVARLSAVRAKVLDGFLIAIVGVVDPMPAVIPDIRFRSWRSGKSEDAAQSPWFW